MPTCRWPLVTPRGPLVWPWWVSTLVLGEKRSSPNTWLTFSTTRRRENTSRWVGESARIVSVVVCHLKKNLFLTAKRLTSVNVEFALCDLCTALKIYPGIFFLFFFFVGWLSRLLWTVNPIWSCCNENVMSPPAGPCSNCTAEMLSARQSPSLRL